METLHNKVVRTLYELSNDYKSYGKVYAHHVGREYQPIVILSHPKRGAAQTYNYYPDVWTEYKQGRIDIFEVWDTESDMECVGDILMAALTPKIKYLSIICLQKNREEFAKKLNKVILGSLYNKFGHHLLKNPYVVFVPDKMNLKEIKNFLREELEFSNK